MGLIRSRITKPGVDADPSDIFAWALDRSTTYPEIGTYLLERRQWLKAQGVTDMPTIDRQLEAIFFDKQLGRGRFAAELRERKPSREERERLAALKARADELLEGVTKARERWEKAQKSFWEVVGGWANAEFLAQIEREYKAPRNDYEAMQWPVPPGTIERYRELRAEYRAAQAALREAHAAWSAAMKAAAEYERQISYEHE